MSYRDLREFIEKLSLDGQLKRIALSVDPYLEMTEICDRTLQRRGPALLFTSPKNHTIPVLANLFGTVDRVALAMGQDNVACLREIGQLLAALKEPEPPQGIRDAWQKLRAFAADLGLQRIYASALSIMFARKICYFFVRPKKTFIEVWIFLPHKIEGLKYTASATSKVRYCNLFKLIHADQVEEPLTDWLREAFDFASGPAPS